MNDAPHPIEVFRPSETSRLFDIVPGAGQARWARGRAFAQNWQLIFALGVAMLDAAALFIGYKLSGPTAISHYHFARQVISVWYVGTFFGIAGVAGLYRRPYTASMRAHFRRCLKSHGVVMTILAVPGLFVFGLERTAELLATLTLVFLPALLIARALALVIRHALLANGWFLERVLLILDEGEGRGLPGWASHLRRCGYDIAGAVRCDSRVGPSTGVVADALEELGARCVIVPSPRYINHQFEPVLELARSQGVTIRVFSPAIQRTLHAAKLDDVPGVTIEAPLRSWVVAVQQATKRVFDAVVATVLLILTAPLLALVALAIRLESPGPPLFRQTRSAAPGRREFTAYKFRSMTVDSPTTRLHLAAANESSGALFKIRRDPRVTRVGRIIRKLSIDELPQLLNVIRGEMSLVGPRPLPTADFSMAVGSEIDGCYHRRSWVKPGLTGLWQISGRSDIGFVDMIMLDLYYAEHGTMFLDFYILLNTLPVVLFGRGAY